MLKNLCQKVFGRSLWVYHANSGGCNGCDIEVLNVLTPYYDVERFGIKLVGSPRHADVMLCQGPAMRSTGKALQRAYAAMPGPKLEFAIGSCACGGGVWHGPNRLQRADGLSTLLMVLGPERGLAFAEREGIKALFVTRSAQGFVSQRSSALQQWLVKGEQP